MNWSYQVYVDTDKLNSIIYKISHPESGIKDIADKTVENIKNNIMTEGVYDTGALHKSITAETRELGFVVRDGVPYGIFNEFGTYRMAARPFFVPALEEVGTLFSETFWKWLK